MLTDLKQGVMDCFIEKKGSRFAVQTPVAVAGVLGTLFKVSADDKKTMITMVEGTNGLEIQKPKPIFGKSLKFLRQFKELR